MSRVLGIALPALLVAAGCDLSQPDAAPRNNPVAMESLEQASNRIVLSRSANPLGAVVEALMKAKCQIIHTDPSLGLVSFTTSRRSNYGLSRDTILDGTLRIQRVEQGLRLHLVMGGKEVWHSSEGDRVVPFSRAHEGFHREFMEIVAERLGDQN